MDPYLRPLFDSMRDLLPPENRKWVQDGTTKVMFTPHFVLKGKDRPGGPHEYVDW